MPLKKRKLDYSYDSLPHQKRQCVEQNGWVHELYRAMTDKKLDSSTAVDPVDEFLSDASSTDAVLANMDVPFKKIVADHTNTPDDGDDDTFIFTDDQDVVNIDDTGDKTITLDDDMYITNIDELDNPNETCDETIIYDDKTIIHDYDMTTTDNDNLVTPNNCLIGEIPEQIRSILIQMCHHINDIRKIIDNRHLRG